MSLIQKQLPGSAVYGDFLAVGKTEMFLRGFQLFTTGRSNHNDLHRGVMPLWRPLDRPSFMFGGRYGSLISNAETYWTITDPRNDQHSAAAVLKQIEPFISELEAINTIADFLKYFEFMRPNQMVQVQLDFALADYYEGDITRCGATLHTIESVLADHDETWFKEFRPVYWQVRQQFDANPLRIFDLTERWRKENMIRFGLSNVRF